MAFRMQGEIRRGLVTAHPPSKRGKQVSTGPDLCQFLVHINQQLACISHLLICPGQEQPKTLLVAEQREKKTFIIKTERRLKRQSRQVHDSTQTHNGPVSHVPCLKAISYENSKRLRHLCSTNIMGHENGGKKHDR